MNIHALNADSDFFPDDPLWYLLVEFPFTVFLLDRDRSDHPGVGFLFQPLRKLGISPECIANMEGTLAEYAVEVRGQFKQVGRALPGRVRIFCQRKMIGMSPVGHAASQPYRVEQALENAPVILRSGTKMNGGWGFFLIERGGNASPDCPYDTGNLIDVYLYREGE